MRLRAVIFDLDGCLTTSVMDFGKMRRMLAEVDTRFLEAPDVLELRARLSPTTRRRVDDAIHAFEEEAAARFQLREETREVLRALDAAEIRRGLVTRNNAAGVAQLQEALGKEAEFEAHHVVHRDVAGIEPKPHPAAVLHLAREWGLEPREIAFVGDGAHDREAALAAHCHSFFMLLHEHNGRLRGKPGQIEVRDLRQVLERVRRGHNFNELFHALGTGSAESVRAVLERAPELLHERNGLREGPLLFLLCSCFRAGAREIGSKVRVLMEAGCDFRAPDSFRDTPLQAASRIASFSLMEKLLLAGARVTDDRVEPLFTRRWLKENTARFLLRNSSPSDAMEALNLMDQLGPGLTPLHTAASRGDTSLIALYIEFGANPLTLTRASRRTALALLVERTRLSCARSKAAAQQLRVAQRDWIQNWSPARHRFLYAGFKTRAITLMMAVKRLIEQPVPKDIRNLLLSYLLANSYIST